ncbi:T-cell ecto-ADP-ribosyltransferase 2-like isoform X2 [Syngnathoides biaculeatus]|uniref:T-cell ecto-ADP-ribosyltransferase 2-like isoform X2 n=2 Tax=Syngnathoides biaculeatus TaxID=300417 RepID=UPI002ADDA73D|nr:T-cell ecto-ADP-ribosyltransferase 2-like isoform X2 [Syngnathoides biaculeatus]
MGCTWLKNLACIATFLLMTCLMVSVIIYLRSHCQYISGKAFNARQYGCDTKPIVLTDTIVLKTMGSYKNFSQAWSEAEEKARKPAHRYIEKQHAVAIYMYTESFLKNSNKKVDTPNISGHQMSKNDTIYIDPRLYSSLSEAIRGLKNSQVTCLKGSYRTQRHLHVDISNKQVRFGSFILASDKKSLQRSSACFEMKTCFGADISHYSALGINNQVLIPPYEVFKVSAVHVDFTEDCNITYKLESNLNCVYDTKGEMLHLISASQGEELWCMVIAVFVTALCLLASLIVFKLYQKKSHPQSLYFQQVTDFQDGNVMHTSSFNLK